MVHFSLLRSRRQFAVLRSLVPLLALITTACGLTPSAPEAAPPSEIPQVAQEPTPTPSTAPKPPPAEAPAVTVASAKPSPSPSAPPAGLVPAKFSDLPGWVADDHASALKAFVQSCQALEARDAWRSVCQSARKAGAASPASARRFFETHFQVFRSVNGDGSDEGLITGYYEPLLHGSRKQSARYRFPLYSVPEDLLVVDLAELYPELKGLRLRGRLDGRRVVPYYSRAQIDRQEPALPAKVLYWVDDPVELFFLQVQGSGQIRLDTGERVRVGYGDQNGHPYRSIGRFLIDRGELTIEQASMQGIKAWAQQNPDKLGPVLHHNSSYVFFRELAANLPGPLGALGVPVTAGRSLAVDPRYVPLGAPVYVATTWPNTKRPLQRLMQAQDTGSAIRGAVRGDYFWGYGDQAGVQAGRMQQRGHLWILLPLGVTPQSLLAR
jgi:membrane-bound lytic murein transglycosylase A